MKKMTAWKRRGGVRRATRMINKNQHLPSHMVCYSRSDRPAALVTVHYFCAWDHRRDCGRVMELVEYTISTDLKAPRQTAIWRAVTNPRVVADDYYCRDTTVDAAAAECARRHSADSITWNGRAGK